MAASDHAQPISRREDALAIVHKLAGAGHVAYFAGGCVRDSLLGLEPKDYDVVTSATPDEARRLFPRSQGVGQAFGVLLIREGHSQIELATFRSDGDYTDGRRPDAVQFATPEEDAQRRDFTINGLYYDPVEDRVIDFVGGVDDLKAGILRAIGDPAKRFAEDYLRLLRAVRFAARFELTIEPATHEAIRRNADRLPRIAPERICDELRATLASPSRLRGEAFLDELGLSDVLMRHAIRLDPPLVSPPRIQLFRAVCTKPFVGFPLGLATLAVETLLKHGHPLEKIVSHDESAALVRSLRSTLRLSNDDCAALRGIIGVAPLLAETEPRVATMKRFLASPDSVDARRLLRGLATIGHSAARVAWLEARFDAFDPETIAPTPLVNGNDLQQAGHRPGPAFKPALDEAYDAQLEGRIATKSDALAAAEAAMRGD